MSFIRTNRYIRLNRAIREGLMDALYDSTIGRTYNPTEYRALYQLKQVLENFPQILPPEEAAAAAAAAAPEEDEFGGDDVSIVAAQMDTAKENARIDDYLQDVKTELLNNLKFYRETGEVGELAASFEESAADSITNYRLQKEVNVVEFKEV